MSANLPRITRLTIPASGEFAHLPLPSEGDVLLLAEGTEIARESIAEMQRVLYLHERHGAVSPRSLHPGLLSLPPHVAVPDAAAAYEIRERAIPLLADYQVVPSLECGCALIKERLLAWCGGFDPSFRSACGALEDFVCRMNRRGFSAVAANRAWVDGPGLPLCTKEERDLLLFRYPEFADKFARFEEFERDPIETFSALFAPHKPRLLYDLYHLTESYSGTSEFGVHLLAALARELAGEVDLYVGADLSNRFFLRELAGYRIYDPAVSGAQVFDLAFKPCQLLSWEDFRRLDRLAPRLAFVLLDVIGIRCDYLNIAARQLVLQHAAAYADAVFSISDFTATDFRARFGQQIPMRTVHLGTSYGMFHEELLPGEHLLVVGNAFAHKGLLDVLPYLPSEWPVVVLGMEASGARANVRSLASGAVSRQHLRDLFSRARIVLYPSYYEGFGLPVADALALGKPTVVLDTEINRELDQLLGDCNLHRVRSFEELQQLLPRLWEAEPANRAEARRWPDAAREYAQELLALLQREIDPQRIRSRRAFLRAQAS